MKPLPKPHVSVLPSPQQFFELSRASLDAMDLLMHAEDVHPTELLLLAYRLVGEAHERFDTNEAKCRECGLRHFTNYTHAKAAERTRGLLTKIENLIRTNPWDRDNTDPRNASNETPRSENNDTKRT